MFCTFDDVSCGTSDRTTTRFQVNESLSLVLQTYETFPVFDLIYLMCYIYKQLDD